jgi:hypothetical protein
MPICAHLQGLLGRGLQQAVDSRYGLLHPSIGDVDVRVFPSRGGDKTVDEREDSEGSGEFDSPWSRGCNDTHRHTFTVAPHEYDSSCASPRSHIPGSPYSSIWRITPAADKLVRSLPAMLTSILLTFDSPARHLIPPRTPKSPLSRPHH